MLLETRNFGSIEYDDNEVIYFQKDILGFEGLKRYIIVGKEDNEPFMWLQSVDEPGLAFVIIEGADVIPYYRPEIPADELKRLDAKESTSLLIYNIVVIPDNIEEISCNLKAPVVINSDNCKAAQVVLDDTDDYEIKHHLKKDLENYSIERERYKECEGFVRRIYQFTGGLKPMESTMLKQKYKGPYAVSLLIVDMINGFCRSGALSSPRIRNLEMPIFDLTKNILSEGAKNIAFLNDCHTKNSAEFDDFPPHAIKGTKECEIVDSLKVFTRGAAIFTKNSLNAFTNPDFNTYVKQLIKNGTQCFIITGNCTDLCIYQTAVTLKMFLNSNNAKIDIIIPYNCVDTFDSYEHAADLINPLFLYHLKANGIKIVKEII